MRPSFEHPCEDGHQLAPTDEHGRYECLVCGLGLWEAGEATEDFDVDAYAHALGMQQISGGGPSGTTLHGRMMPEENSGSLSLSGMKQRPPRPPTRSNSLAPDQALGGEKPVGAYSKSPQEPTLCSPLHPPRLASTARR